MTTTRREAFGTTANPLGVEGLEFVEYTTAKPQALGQALETMGFLPVARHRSREVLQYRQGDMNIVVNAEDESADEAPAISAFALRVHDAGAAYRCALDRGAWPVPVRVEPMELHIPAIHGVGQSRIYLIDRWRDFSIWDIDFVPIPTVDPHPPAVAGMHWFGLVQYIGLDRMEDWSAFYGELFGWSVLPDDERFGILPRGRLMQGPRGLMIQLVEPEIDAATFDHDESLQRIGFGVPDVMAAVAALRERGARFVETERLHTQSRGALAQTPLPSVMFELVRDP